MARAALFVASSIALHGAAVALMLTGRRAAIEVPVDTRVARTLVVAPEPLLLEGATLEAPETPHEPVERASPSTAAAPAPARNATAEREEPGLLRAVAAGGRERASSPPNTPQAAHAGGTPLPASAAHAESAANAVATGSAAGAPRTVFGTAVLRSFLLALSADARALEDAQARYRLRYEGGDGVATRVRAEPEDAAGLRMARALEALLAQTSAGLPPLAGTLDVEASRGELADGVFTITCDDANRLGSVRFTDGRRVRVREAR